MFQTNAVADRRSEAPEPNITTLSGLGLTINMFISILVLHIAVGIHMFILHKHIVTSITVTTNVIGNIK